MRIHLIGLCALALTACAAQNSGPTYVLPDARALLAIHPVARWTKTSIGKFADPYGVSVHPNCTGSCDVFVSDPGKKTVYVVHPDGSRAPIADFSSIGPNFDPQGISVSQDGHIYVADKAPGGVSYVWSVAGVGGALSRLNTSFANFPRYNRAVAAESHYVNGNDQVRAVYGAQATHFPLTHHGRVECLFGGSCAFHVTDFNDPYGVAIDRKGIPVVIDARDKKAYRCTGGGNIIDLGGTFVDPYGIAETNDGQYVYVADAGAKKVYERAPDGTWTEIGAFVDPYSVTVQADRTVYVADHGDGNVYKLTP